ncbi:Uncharacterized protein Fot_12796 [Forsythia ovata]|uniref:Uncharacterized protein n=1 Tax=Forsythia ovata TaxID=205694 RepID=A0ABD1W3T9_9LAMI
MAAAQLRELAWAELLQYAIVHRASEKIPITRRATRPPLILMVRSLSSPTTTLRSAAEVALSDLATCGPTNSLAARILLSSLLIHCLIQDPGHPEISNLNSSPGIYQKIRGLDVAMNDFALVEVMKARENLASEMR